MDKFKAFIKKYKTAVVLSLCFIFALCSTFLLKPVEIDKGTETKVEETRAFITKSNNEPIDKKYKEENIQVMPEERVKKNEPIPEAFPDSKYEKEPLVTKESLEKEKSLTASSTAPFSPIMPASGNKTTPFSVYPIYSETMDDWRSHEGIDIALETGGDVVSSEKGIVTFVGKDPLLGITIKISHGDTYETLYANLHSETRVYEGQEVSKGQIIGHAGESSVTESAIGPHLHFELLKNGKRVNPEEYIR